MLGQWKLQCVQETFFMGNNIFKNGSQHQKIAGNKILTEADLPLTLNSEI